MSRRPRAVKTSLVQVVEQQARMTSQAERSIWRRVSTPQGAQRRRRRAAAALGIAALKRSAYEVKTLQEYH